MTITTRAGNFRHVVTIEENQGEKTSTGAKADDWQPHISNIRAAIWPYKGRERNKDGEFILQTYHNVRIYYRDGITSDMRVKFGARYLYIKEILNAEERNRFIDLLCREDQ